MSYAKKPGKKEWQYGFRVKLNIILVKTGVILYEFANAMIDAGIYTIISHPSGVVPLSSLSIVD
ncbi:MAG: hypothetical protein ABI543_03245 [Ignavibacteria bacterium]